MHKKLGYSYYCIHARTKNIDAMVCASSEITVTEFEENVRRSDLDHLDFFVFEYRTDTLLRKKDWHIKYFKSIYKGEPCIYLVHSAVEYIFC